MATRILDKVNVSAIGTSTATEIPLPSDIGADEAVVYLFEGDHTEDLELVTDQNNSDGLDIKAGKEWVSGPWEAKSSKRAKWLYTTANTTSATIHPVVVPAGTAEFKHEAVSLENSQIQGAGGNAIEDEPLDQIVSNSATSLVTYIARALHDVGLDELVSRVADNAGNQISSELLSSSSTLDNRGLFNYGDRALKSLGGDEWLSRIVNSSGTEIDPAKDSTVDNIQTQLVSGVSAATRVFDASTTSLADGGTLGVHSFSFTPDKYVAVSITAKSDESYKVKADVTSANTSSMTVEITSGTVSGGNVTSEVYFFSANTIEDVYIEDQSTDGGNSASADIIARYASQT